MTTLSDQLEGIRQLIEDEEEAKAMEEAAERAPAVARQRQMDSFLLGVPDNHVRLLLIRICRETWLYVHSNMHWTLVIALLTGLQRQRHSEAGGPREGPRQDTRTASPDDEDEHGTSLKYACGLSKQLN